MQHTVNVTPISAARPKVLEFFAGIGLARIGLERAGFSVAWANDYEQDKKAMYQGHFRDDERGSDHRFVLGDVFAIDHSEIPRDAAVAWGSSPCTDLSLAGSRAGIRAGESNAFWGFIEALELLEEARPPVVVLENVLGLATSHGGDDLAAAIRAFNDLGYSVDVLAIDAKRFVPQSRPRLFIVGALRPPTDAAAVDSTLRPDFLNWIFDDETLMTHRAPLPVLPPAMTTGLDSAIEDMGPADSRWWDKARSAAFLASMSQIQRHRLDVLRDQAGVHYRTAYRRTRKGVATWEMRPDEISGCLRTARGGSSKQAVVRIDGDDVRVRWMTPLEYARLMGAGDYRLDGARTTQALFAFGDAVAVPAVEWLSENYLMPLVRRQFVEQREAARVVQ